MKIIYTLHVEDKLQEEEIKALEISKNTIAYVLENPIATDKKVNPHHSVGYLNNELSLNIIWKKEKEDVIIKVVTFYPAGGV